MKIVILNGSPRKDGNTEIMCKAFADATSHETVILNIAAMNIKGCLGCKYCYKNNGECVQKDDMLKVTEELKTADMVVFASPVYWFDINAQLKTVIDRMYSFGSIGFNFNKTALLLDSASDHVFDAAIAQYKAMTSYLKWEDKGIITIYGMENKGDMKDSERLDEVIRLAKSL